MKRREWRKIRAGQGLEAHPLSRQPLDAAAQNVSPAMVNVLRRLLRRPEADGASLRSWQVTTKQLEALVKRGLVDVVWARVPHRAPVDIKVDAVSVSERGRALIAVLDLRAEQYAISDAPFVGIQWGVPLGVSSLRVGQGGGGAAAAQVAAAINRQIPGVVASPVGHNGISISSANNGPTGKVKPIRNAAGIRAEFDRPNGIIVPEGTKVEGVPGKNRA